ncbi:MAG: hypothetical protein RR426_06290, partial [Oscillospiraceae bacterium]
MVKGISRRVVVVNSPDPRIFEQAIFIVRNDALMRDGVSAQEIVEEARRVAKSYGDRKWNRHLAALSPLLYTLLGAG